MVCRKCAGAEVEAEGSGKETMKIFFSNFWGAACSLLLCTVTGERKNRHLADIRPDARGDMHDS